MKTVIDWSKAPEWAREVGTTSGVTSYWMDDVSYQLCLHDKNPRVFFSNYDSKNKSSFLIIAYRPEVKQVTVPKFTQEMCDAGTLPSVGMEVLYTCIKHQSGKPVIEVGKWYSGTIIAYHDGFVWTSDNGLRQLSNTKFKPLTPPIELIDGERYHFVHEEYGGSLGIYNSVDEKFYNWDMWAVASHCTNIQLLEVKS